MQTRTLTQTLILTRVLTRKWMSLPSIVLAVPLDVVVSTLVNDSGIFEG
jgi:hypothetical protein